MTTMSLNLFLLITVMDDADNGTLFTTLLSVGVDLSLFLHCY